MSNNNWVCFTCREAVRRPGSADNVRCPKCAQACQNIGYKIPVPPKSKPKLWQALQQCRAEAMQNDAAYSVRRMHDLEKEIINLEQEISRIEAMPENAGRRSLIKSLNKQLNEIKQSN
jgi:DNA-directed RNA polymerase subunit RPC12/RpoP